jgi:hypothetical protein
MSAAAVGPLHLPKLEVAGQPTARKIEILPAIAQAMRPRPEPITPKCCLELSMKRILLTAVLMGLSQTAAYAADAAPLPESSVEIFRIAPGQHENFLKMLAETEAVMAEVGLPQSQLYIHEDGASWDFILVKPHGLDEKKWQLVSEKLRKSGHPTGPDYFFTIRKMIAEHTDTTAIGPTTATAYLATRVPTSH